MTEEKEENEVLVEQVAKEEKVAERRNRCLKGSKGCLLD